MKLFFTPLLILLVLSLSVTSLASRQELNFNADWKFHLKDNKEAKSSAFDDHSWRKLNLPHDWSFEEDYGKDAVQKDMGGYKPGGIAWYRKHFDISKSWSGKQISIEFDGVYMNSEVWINGHYLGKRPYGYISFSYDLTPYLKPSKNLIAVRVDNSREPSARWYHACGIYAHVKLVSKSAVHIPKDGTWVRTDKVSAKKAEISIETELNNSKTSALEAVINVKILAPDGKEVQQKSQRVSLRSKSKSTIHFSIDLPQLWDINHPHLYKAVTTVSVNGKQTDESTSSFGLRSIQWKTESGFWLNGKNIKLLGVSDHLEAGPVGGAISDELLRWKIKLLKDMGCNAIRVAHNPQVPKFYEICNEMGILVMDEIFDGWHRKAPQDYGAQAFNQWWKRDLTAWIKRDRNHPCVIIWSLGNETHGKVAAEMVQVCHSLDPTRLTTSGHSASHAMDVLGVNGHSGTPHFFKHKPSKPFVSTEAPHTWQVRGFYRSKTWFRDGYNESGRFFPCPDFTEKEIFTYDWIDPAKRANRKQIFNSSYDNAMVRITARKNWELMRDLPWHSGHFRWTGFDYIGEAGYVHGGWPFRAFMGGALDLAGFKKDLYYFYQSQWAKEPMAHILPHWTHPKMKAGTKIPVWVYSNCDEVELFLNGKSLGTDKPEKKWDEMQCEWFVPWTPGKLEAVAYKDRKIVTRSTQISASQPAKLQLSVEGDRNPIVTVVQCDTKGTMNPYAENRIYYHVDGAARLISLEGGNPVNTENNYRGNSRTAFFGKTRAFLEKKEASSSLLVAAICGDKELMTSNKVSIDVQEIALNGKREKSPVKIFYSIDGSKPTTLYTAPFRANKGTVVKADIYRGSKLLISMSERFGFGEGLYWGDTEDLTASYGDQAEDAKFTGAVIAKKGKGFHGRGYLDFGNNKNGAVEWYQENDGSAHAATLKIRYAGKALGRKGRFMKLSINGMEQNIFLPNTKAYGNDWKFLSVKIKLARGANTIRLSSPERGAMNIDEILLK